MKRNGESSPPESDASLLGRLHQDAGALEEFYRRHFEGVTRYIARRCGTPHDLADAVSATFLGVLVSSSSYDPDLGSPRSWLYSVAANAARRQARTRDRDAALYGRVRGSRFLTANDIERLVEVIDAERIAAEIVPVVASAPEGEKDLLERIVNDQVPTAEAARSLGISESAARKRLSRLRGRVERDRYGDGAVNDLSIVKEETT